MVYWRLLATSHSSCAMHFLTTWKCLCHGCVLILRRVRLVRFPCRMTAYAAALRTASARDIVSIAVSCRASMRCVSCTAARSCRTFHFLAGCVAVMKDSQSVEVRRVVMRTSQWSKVGMATVWYGLNMLPAARRD